MTATTTTRRAMEARRAAAAVAVAAALAACGCDAPYQQFLGSIPTEEVDPDAPVEVFLGIDGLSRRAFDLARARGAFADYHAADLITPFPGTSDYSWTRTLRAGALGGYELQYFDPHANAMENRGLVGVAEHPLREGIADTLPAYQRFDFLGDGETWMLDSYLDPVASLRPTLDHMFDTVAARGRTKSRVMAYLLNVDVVGHLGGLDQAVAMLVEIDRRIRAFKADHRRRFQFTLFADHGNAHQRSQLVDPVRILTDVGVASVDALAPPAAADAPPPLEAVAVVHVRVNYVALHAARHNVVDIAARTSRHPYVDLAVARLPDDAAGAQRFGIWRQGVLHRFTRDAAGTIVVDDPDGWCWLGLDFGPWRDHGGATAKLTDRQAFDATVSGPYPDVFYRVATAFTHAASRFPADILLSMPDDVASVGFAVPGAVVDIRAADGFHGALSRASTLSVVASDSNLLPPALRSDELADMFPALMSRAAK